MKYAFFYKERGKLLIKEFLILRGKNGNELSMKFEL